MNTRNTFAWMFFVVLVVIALAYPTFTYFVTPNSIHTARLIEREHISAEAIEGAMMISQANAAQAEAMLNTAVMVLMWGLVGVAVVAAVWLAWKGEKR